MSSLAPSRHQCLVYDGDSGAHLSVLAPIISGRLNERWRCLHLGPVEEVPRLTQVLERGSVDTAARVKSGQLVFSSDRGYLTGGFQPRALVEMLRGLVEQAAKDGFAGLFATGDMRWELPEDEYFESLLEYEARLELLFEQEPRLSGLCQYRRDRLPARAIRDALLAHRSVYLGAALQEDNLFYVPPDLLLESPGAVVRDKQGDWMWRQIVRLTAAERERDEARRRLEEAKTDLELKVDERTEQLRASRDEYEAFAYSVAHDLRAPLRSINGFSDILARRFDKDLPEEAKQLLKRVSDSGRRMDELTADLLSYSRLSRQEIELEPLDLEDVVAHVLEAMSDELKARDADVSVAAPLPRASAHAGMLAQALTNLLSNAVKFVKPGARPKISIRAETRGARVRLWVEDDGIGIEPRYHERIFKVFQRLHTAEQFPGTGIGLAIVSRAAARMNGRAGVESSPGAGSRFWLELTAA